MPAPNYQSFINYRNDLAKTLEQVTPEELDQVVAILTDAFHTGKTVFVAGNGGSAATASHFACDLIKSTLGTSPMERSKRPRCISLSDSNPIITAYANDVHYERVFSEPLRSLANPGDVLLVITASGNSPNILRALEAAKECKVKTIGFLGFSGGKSKDLADLPVIFQSEHYGLIEDAHSIFMHFIIDCLKHPVHVANQG